MKYKTTYFKLSLNNSISCSSPSINELICRDELNEEVNQLERQITKEIKKHIESIWLQPPVKVQGKSGKDKNGKKIPLYDYGERRTLNAEEKKEILRQYQMKDINQWGKIGRLNISGKKVDISMENILRSDSVVKFKKQKERLEKIVDMKRYTKEDEQNLNNHLNENAVDGWRLHSINPISKGLYNWSIGERAGAGYGHDIMEGFVLIWEKES